MIRYRATLSYDGARYQGFQRQAEGIPTIQGAVEAALARVTGQAATVIGAGRTDTGVHALAQVIAFEVVWRHDDSVLLRALNAVLPPDIALQDLRRQPGFHPRFDALSRTYAYTVIHAAQRQPLWHGRGWHIYGPCDLDVLRQTAALLLGEHDFATFGHPPKGTNTVRQVLRSEWELHPEPFGRRLVYRVEANAFLEHMVRRLVGTQIDVARGLMSVADFQSAFAAADLGRAGTLAPPQGLTLESVSYP